MRALSLLKNKRGEEEGAGMPMSTIVGIVLLLAGFLVIIAIVTGLPQLLFGSQSDFRICQLSLAAQANTRTIATGGDSVLQINCVWRFLEVTEHAFQQVFPDKAGSSPQSISVYYTKTDGTVTRTKSYDAVSEEILYSSFAESMRNCWAMGLEGKQPIMQLEGGLFTPDTKIACVVCDQITVKSVPPTMQSDFETYIEKTKIPNNKDGLTYAQYFFPDTVIHDSHSDILVQKDCPAYSFSKLDRLTSIGIGTYYTVLVRDFNIDGSDCLTVQALTPTQLDSVCEATAN